MRGARQKSIAPLEHERICLACGLDPANYDAGRPPIYAVFLAEGRSMVKVEAVMQKFLAPAPNDWDPIRVYMSQELVRGMKDLKFGWGNENTHDTMPPGNLPLCRPSGLHGPTNEATQDPGKGRPCKIFVNGRRQGWKLSQGVAQHPTMG